MIPEWPVKIRTSSKVGRGRKEIASPETVLKAAERAPRLFDVAAYFRGLYIMRDKGHSWRDLAQWLRQFKIEISHAHLRRLYIEEDERLSRLTVRELSELGMPEDQIKEFLEKHDPTKRLTAADITDREIAEKEDEAIEIEKFQREGINDESK
jgi:uncharacterized protein YdaT